MAMAEAFAEVWQDTFQHGEWVAITRTPDSLPGDGTRIWLSYPVRALSPADVPQVQLVTWDRILRAMWARNELRATHWQAAAVPKPPVTQKRVMVERRLWIKLTESGAIATVSLPEGSDFSSDPDWIPATVAFEKLVPA